MKWRTMKFHVMLCIFYITNIYSVPEDYCFGVLDKRDCGLPPTPVFSYIKPGSRCEIETWRGCPSQNLFHNEYQCSDLCIGKLFRPSGEGKTGEPPKEVENKENSVETTMEETKATEDVQTIRCDVPLNTDNCTDEETQVFTFDNATRACVEATYRGCETENKFDDKEQCENTCLNNKDKWAKTINNLKDKDLEKIKNIVDKAEENPDKSSQEDVKADEVTSTETPEQLKNRVSEVNAPKAQILDEEKQSDSIEEAVILRGRNRGKNKG